MGHWEAVADFAGAASPDPVAVAAPALGGFAGLAFQLRCPLVSPVLSLRAFLRLQSARPVRRVDFSD